MALELKLGITSIQDEIRVFDKTGVYDVTTNPTGYGTPNEDVSIFTSALVIVTLPDGTQTNAIDVFPTLPTDNNTIMFAITPVMLGVPKLAPGIYSINYTIDQVSGGVSVLSFSTSEKYFHYEPIQCCISKKLKKMSFTCSTDEEICEIAIAERRLKAAIHAACSGNYEEATIISDQLWDKCGCCC